MMDPTFIGCLQAMKVTNKKVVTFSEEVKIFYEPEGIAEDLQKARRNNDNERKADKDRMERLIGPILSSYHRENISKKLFDTN